MLRVLLGCFLSFSSTYTSEFGVSNASSVKNATCFMNLFESNTAIYLSVKVSLFSYPSIKTFLSGAEKPCLIETVLLSTHSIFFG